MFKAVSDAWVFDKVYIVLLLDPYREGIWEGGFVGGKLPVGFEEVTGSPALSISLGWPELPLVEKLLSLEFHLHEWGSFSVPKLLWDFWSI